MNGIIPFINEACDPEAGPHPIMLTPWPQTSSLQNWDQYLSVFQKPPVYGISLQQLASYGHLFGLPFSVCIRVAQDHLGNLAEV